ncbi:hypothetical protein TNIN_293311 [Trichonephila inaurata madagascariensis]|uniref:Uncharacterized protein n=1 Tax=Trichonephila inaurata madagascariensis TaxID=2747483 RepID=A0A8X6WTI4_9ARAC|nr:hypothetical protein TNIN_293311 [Trichonephila inaurata madagascariensis]
MKVASQKSSLKQLRAVQEDVRGVLPGTALRRRVPEDRRSAGARLQRAHHHHALPVQARLKDLLSLIPTSENKNSF